jgi:hypothetical protein
MNTTPYRILGSSTEMADNYVNPYYVEDLKHRVVVARIRGKLFAFDDLYKECHLSAGLLAGTTIMSQADGSQFGVTTAVLRGRIGDEAIVRIKCSREHLIPYVVSKKMWRRDFFP